MMDKYFKVSIFFFFLLKATLSSFKKRERCDFITKHLTDFAVLYSRISIARSSGDIRKNFVL